MQMASLNLLLALIMVFAFQERKTLLLAQLVDLEHALQAASGAPAKMLAFASQELLTRKIADFAGRDIGHAVLIFNGMNTVLAQTRVFARRVLI